MGPPIPILVVEDEPLIQELIRDALDEGGYDVALAPSGEEALAVLEHRLPDFRALVTDVHLRPGGLTGWDLARRARETNPDLPVVYMTAAAAPEWAANGVPRSVLLTKPFAPAQVVTAVSQLLNAAATE